MKRRDNEIYFRSIISLSSRAVMEAHRSTGVAKRTEVIADTDSVVSRAVSAPLPKLGVGRITSDQSFPGGKMAFGEIPITGIANHVRDKRF